ncbi:MAG: exo-beta-N-acetylmuramidase NamZ domain-containing protein [Bacteroidales bacterium]
MVKTGLDNFEKEIYPLTRNRRAGLVCHAPSINRRYEHITDIFHNSSSAELSAIFGPQHGLFGQTQDNMIEWEGYLHPVYKVPVYSLYGKTRKPTPGMLTGTDILIFDLQDVGTRPYTYAWTLKHCMEACAENNIPLVVIDRPNPIGGIKRDGPVLKEDFYSFVGGAGIPLCHGMTMGEIAIWLKEKESINCRLEIIKMQGWQREMMWTDTGLPWVLPSPNMPSPGTAMVYPGMVLIEALNISEGRGTTLPFELCGAPFPEMDTVISELNKMNLPGTVFRKHNFIPVFHKFADQYCYGMQVHITDFNIYEPVYTAACIFKMIADITAKLRFNDPPYEYEDKLMPFDILSGDTGLRTSLEGHIPLSGEKERWREEINEFNREFACCSLY